MKKNTYKNTFLVLLILITIGTIGLVGCNSKNESTTNISNEQNEKFVNIDVEKLNIVEKDGTVKMSLFNSENIPSLIMEGEDICPGHRQGDNSSGIMFYNGEGSECGGLIFGSTKGENDEHESWLSLTFDQYNQDQLLQMSVTDYNGEQNYGITISDRPNKSLKELIKLMDQMEKTKDENEKQKLMQELYKDNHHRMFMGKNSNGEVSVKLNDSKGNERIKIAIDKDDNPKIEFLNEKGEVIYSLPPEQINQ